MRRQLQTKRHKKREIYRIGNEHLVKQSCAIKYTVYCDCVWYQVEVVIYKMKSAIFNLDSREIG